MVFHAVILMKAKKIKDNIYWVGAIDWDLREFHGVTTHQGSSYNAYLILDEKVVLVDTVRDYLSFEMIERIKSVIDPSKIDIVVSNHSELDHAGSVPDIMKIAKNATLVCSKNGKINLSKHFEMDSWKIKVVKDNEKINIGKRDLKFILMQMVHWPDSMATYIEKDKLLMPNDLFGQHIACFERFDEEIGFDIVMLEAKKYYANILLAYNLQTKNAIEHIKQLDIDMIAPSHGVIWKKHIKDLIQSYDNYANNKVEEKAVIIYDTMWGSTKKMAYSIFSAFDENGISVSLKNLQTNDISDIMTDVIDAKYICFGSSTLNETMLPRVAKFLSYLKGFKPKNKKAICFGSYGWKGEGALEVKEDLIKMGFEILDLFTNDFVPSIKELKSITKKVKDLLL
jgi:flavorubredoxin